MSPSVEAIIPESLIGRHFRGQDANLFVVLPLVRFKSNRFVDVRYNIAIVIE